MALLLNAALEGDAETVHRLINEQPNLINWKNEDEWTALMVSAENGHTDVVNILLEHGSDIHKQDKDGYTALMISAQNGHIDVVKILLEHGSDIDKQDKYGWTALMLSARNGHTDVVKILIKYDSDIEKQNIDGATALMKSAHNGHTDVVKILLECGADIHRQTNEGTTALMFSAMIGHTDVIRLLLEHGADLHRQSNLGNTALHYCLLNEDLSYNQHTRVTVALLMADRDIAFVKNKEGVSPIDIYEANECIQYNAEERSEQKLKLLQILKGGPLPDLNSIPSDGPLPGFDSLTPGSFIPVEILARGSQARSAFIEALEKDEKNVYQGRIVVMGLERVGKTSFIHSFLKKEFNPNEEITDAIATNKMYIQDSSDDWQQAAEDQSNIATIFKDEVEQLISKAILKKKRELRKEQVMTEKPEEEHNEIVFDTKMKKGKAPTVLESMAKKAETKMRFTREATSEWQEPKDEFIMNIWDFGGQPIYHIIQRVFIVSFSVVCVVFNLKDNLDAPAVIRDPTTGEVYQHRMTYFDFLLYFVRTVYQTCSYFTSDGSLFPPIYIIGTHRNSVGETEEERKFMVKEIKDKIWNGLKGKPYEQMVLKIFDIENSLPFDMSGSADILAEILESNNKMVRTLPLKWLFVQQEIQKLKKEKIYQETSKIIALLEHCGVKENQNVLLEYLHDTGEIIYYSQDKALRDIIVLDPMQVVILSKAIITVVDPNLKDPKLRAAWRRLDSGVLEEPLLRHLWDEFITSDVMFDFFVALMQRFGLLCERKVKKGEGRLFLVLARLKPIPVTSPPEDYGNRAISIYHDFSNYLPDDLFQRVATKFFEEFQMEDCEPKLLYEHVELDIYEHHHVILSVETIKYRRMFKTTIIRRKILNSDHPDLEPEPSVCKKVLDFLNAELKIFCKSGSPGLDVKIYIPCDYCQEIHWHIVRHFNRDVLPCGSNGFEVKRYRRLFGDNIPKPQHGDSFGAVGDPPTIEGFVDDATMQTIAEEMDLSWKRFGLRLGLEMSTIDKINTDHLTAAVFAMLFQWRNKCKHHQDRMLYTALCDHGHKSLAVSLFGTELYIESLSIEKQIRTDIHFNDQDLLFICKLLDHAVTAWKRLGVRLGLRWAKINNFNERETADNIIKMLIFWRNGHPDRQIPTMVNALKDQRLPEIADRVCKRHVYEDRSEEKSSCLERKMMTTDTFNDQDLLFICDLLCNEAYSGWRRLGVRLGLNWGLINTLCKNSNEEDNIMEVLVCWRNRYPHNQLPTMINALKQQRLIGIAKNVQERYGYVDESRGSTLEIQRKNMPTGYMFDMDIVFMAEMMDEDWTFLGSQLSVGKYELDDIQMKFPYETADATVETLVRWRDRQERNDNHLDTVINKLNLIGRKDIVEELELMFRNPDDVLQQRIKAQEKKFHMFLSSLSEHLIDHDFNYKWFRFLLYDLTQIQMTSEDGNNALALFTKLADQSHISSTNVIILSDIIELALPSAKHCIDKYRQGVQCKKGTILKPFRKTFFKALKEVEETEFKHLKSRYKIDHGQDRFADIWDLVFHMEMENRLDDTQEKWKPFVNHLNEKAKEIMLEMIMPPEIKARGVLAVESYKSEMASGKTKMVHSRIMVLGKEGAGKTSCIKAMLGKEFNKKEPPTAGIVTTTIFRTDDKDNSKWNEEKNVDVYDMTKEILDTEVAGNIRKKLEQTSASKPKDSPMADVKSKQKEGTSTESIQMPVSKETFIPKNISRGMSAERNQTPVPKETSNPTQDESYYLKPATSVLLATHKFPTQKQLEDINSDKEKRNEKENTEIGVEILKSIPTGIRFKLFDESINISPKDLTFVMDYAGHLVYYVTHRIFLTNRTIYFVVFSLVEELDKPARPRDNSNKGPFNMTNLQMIVFWTRSIYEYAILPSEKTILNKKIRMPPIILVGTHRDKMVGSEDKKKAKIEDIRKKILKEFEDMPYENHVEREIYAVDNSSKSDEGIKMLKEKAVTYMKTMPTEVPISWFDFQAKILKLAKTKLTMSEDEIIEIARDCGISEVKTVLNYLNDTGIILYSALKKKLKDTVIINLPMIIKMMTKIFTTESECKVSILSKSWRNFYRTGILSQELLDHFWEEDEMKRNSTICLEVMKIFSLLFEKEDKDGNKVFLVPSQMKDPEKCLQVKVDETDTVSFYVTPTDFLPDSLYNVLVVCFLNEMQQRGRNMKIQYSKLFRNCSEFDLYDDHCVSLGAVKIGNRHALKLEISRLPDDDSTEELEPKSSICMEILTFLKNQLTEYGTAEGVGYNLHALCKRCIVKDIDNMHELNDCLRKKKIQCNKKMVKSRFKYLFAGKERKKRKKDSADRFDKDDSEFMDFLLELSCPYSGINCKWLRFLLYDHLSISVLSQCEDDGLKLFLELKEINAISCNDVTILSDIADATNIFSAKKLLVDYQKTRKCSLQFGKGIPKYRISIFRALNELTEEDVKRIETFYSLSRYKLSDKWDIVFCLESKKFSKKGSSKKKSWARFAKLLTGEAERLVTEALKLWDQPSLAEKHATKDESEKRDGKRPGPSTDGQPPQKRRKQIDSH